MATPPFRGAGLNPLSYLHHTEHLAPLCVLMGIPLLFADEAACEQARLHYPEIDARFLEQERFTPRHLMQTYDALFHADIWNIQTVWNKLLPLEQELGKRIRSVHCPHGFSDKTFWFKEMAQDDICLIYGQNMEDMLEELAVLAHIPRRTRMGNVRFSYYLKHQVTLDALVQQEVFSHFSQDRPVVLYAPTWADREDNGTFFAATTLLVEQCSQRFNLLIKLHPHMEEHQMVELYQMMGKHAHEGHVHFLEQYPLIYPLLSRSAVYVGDMSSVGYDFLAFNRPMLFLNQKRIDPLTDRKGMLFRCGRHLLPEQYGQLGKSIEQVLAEENDELKQVRAQLYQYTFGVPTCWETAKESIIALCQGAATG